MSDLFPCLHRSYNVKLLEILLPDIDYFEVGIFKTSECHTSKRFSLKSLILYRVKEFTVKQVEWIFFFNIEA